MATFSSDVVSGNQTFKPFPGGTVGVRYAKFTTTAASAANDIYQMVDVFAGETLYDIKIKCSDMDSGGSPAIVFGVGDGTDADRYIAASTAGQGGTADESDADVAPVAYAADDTIDVTCEVAPATGVAVGTIELWAFVA